MIKLKYILALLFIFSFVGCSGNSGNWGWYVIDPTTKSGLANIKFLVGGFGSTILLSLIAAFNFNYFRINSSLTKFFK